MPTLKLGGIEHYYETAGEGEPLLLIHGLGSSTRDWEYQLPFFAPRYRVVTYDVRGHGRSAKPRGPYGVEVFAADAAALIRRLEITPAHVVGISMGGMIGLELAARSPELVGGLVVINSPTQTFVTGLRAHYELYFRLVLCGVLGLPGMAWFLARRLFPDPGQKALRRTFRRRWIDNDRRTYLTVLRSLVGWSVKERLGDVACPTLVLSGENDFVDPADKRACAAGIHRGSLVEIAGSRHATTIDRPAETNAAIDAFLSSFRA